MDFFFFSFNREEGKEIKSALFVICRLYPRWKEAETLQANLLQFSLDETQWQEDWAMLLSLASQPGSALEQMHIFTLAHILRRPIIVYGVKYVKSFRGEALGYARFEGKVFQFIIIYLLFFKALTFFHVDVAKVRKIP